MWDASIGWLLALCFLALAWSYKRDATYEAEESKAVRSSLLQTQVALRASVARNQEASQQSQRLAKAYDEAKAETAGTKQQTTNVSEQLTAKQIEFRRLQQKLADATKTEFNRERFSNDISNLQQKNQDLTQQLAVSKAALSETEAVRAAEQQNAKQQAATTSQQLDEQQQRLAVVEAQAEKDAKLAADANAQQLQLIADQTAREGKLQGQVLEQSTQLQKEQSAHNSAKRQLTQLQTEHDSVKISCDLLQQEVKAVSKHNADLSTEVRKHQTSLEDVKAKAEALQAEHQTTLAVVQDLRHQVEVQQQNNIQREQQVSELQSNKTQLEQELAARPQQAEVDTAIAERNSFQQQLSEQEALAEKFKAINADYAAAKEDLKQQDSLTQQLNALQDQLQGHEDIAAQLQHIQALHQDATSQAEQLTTERNTAVTEVEQLQKQLADRPSQHAMEQATLQMQALQQQAEQQQQEHQQLLQQVQAELELAQAKARDSESLQAKLQQLQAVADSKQAQAEQIQKLLSDKSAEHDMLQQQLQQLEDNLQASAERLAQAQSDHEQHAAEVQAELSNAQALIAASVERLEAHTQTELADGVRTALAETQTERTGLELQQQEHDLREASTAASASALAYRELQRQQADGNRVLQHLTERLQDSSQDRQDVLAKLSRLQAQIAGTEAEAAASAESCKQLQQRLQDTEAALEREKQNSDLVRLTLVVRDNQREAPANHSARAGQDLLKDIKEKQALCNHLQQQLAASQHRVQELETETHDLSDACGGAAVVVKNMENEVAAAKQELANPDQARGRLRSLQAQLASAEQELSVHKSKAGLWQTDAAQAWRDRDQAQDALSGVRTDLASANTEARVLLLICQELQKQVSQSSLLQDRIADMHGQLDCRQELQPELEQQVTLEQSDTFDLQAKLLEAEQSRDTLQRQLDQQEADLGGANTEACVLLQMCIELQKQAAQQQAIAGFAVSTAEADRGRAQDHVTALENQVVQAHLVAKGLLAKLTEKEDSMQQLEEEKSQAEKALEAGHAQMEALAQEVITAKEAALQGARAKKAADLSIERERFQKNVKAALKEKAQAEADLKSAQEQLSHTREHLNSSNGQLTTVQSELGDATAQLSRKQQQLSSAEEDLGSAKAELSSLQEQLSSARKGWGGTQEQLASVQDQLVSASTRLSNTQEQLSSAVAAVKTKEGEVQEMQQALESQRGDLEIMTRDRNDLQQEVMTRLEHLNALNKGLSEYKSMCKGLQEQLDQLRNIREVQAGYAGSSRSDYDDQAPSLLNSPQPGGSLSASQPGSGSLTAAGFTSPADLSSAFAAAHSLQTVPSAHKSPQPEHHLPEESPSTIGVPTKEHNGADHLVSEVLLEGTSGAPPEAAEAVSHHHKALPIEAETGNVDQYAAGMHTSEHTSQGHSPAATSPDVFSNVSSPQSNSSSSKENRPDMHGNSMDRAYSLGGSLTVKTKATTTIDTLDGAPASNDPTPLAGVRADAGAEHTQEDADVSEDAFAADTDETLTASQASENGLSRQGSMSGLSTSSYAHTPTSRMSEMSDGFQMRHAFAHQGSRDTPTRPRLPLSMTTPPGSPALPTSAVLGQSKRRNSSASIASTGSTPRTVRQDVQSQSGYSLSVAAIFDKPNT